MAVKIDEQMYNTFTSNGFSEDDIQNTVTHYRNQGMSDDDIFSNMTIKYNELTSKNDVLPEKPNKTPEQWEQQRQQIEGAPSEISQVSNPLGIAAMLATPEVKAFQGATLMGRVANRALTGGLFGGVQSALEKIKGENPNVLGNVVGGAVGNVALAPVAEAGVGLVNKLAKPIAEKGGEFVNKLFNRESIPTVGEAPIQQVTPKKFAIEADTDVPISQVEQPSVSAIEQPSFGVTKQPLSYEDKINKLTYDWSSKEGKFRYDDNFKQNIDTDTMEIHDNLNNVGVGAVQRFAKQHDVDVQGVVSIGVNGKDLGREGRVWVLGKFKDAKKGYTPYGILQQVDEVKPIQQSSAIDQPQVNVPEMVQPQVPVPQGQVKTRGGIKTVEKTFGEDVSNQITNRTYETRGLARNEAEFANLTPEQQMDLVKTDDISDLAVRAKQKNLENQVEAGAISGYDLNKYTKQGTENAQALQARANINTPVGALSATQSVIRKATPKRINNIIDNADNIVDAVTTARTSAAKVTNLENALKGTVKRERKYLVDKILKLDTDGQLNADKVIEIVNKKYNIPEINQADVAKIKELTNRISEATTERESEVAKGLLRKLMVDKVPKTVRNKVNTYRYINMLLSPKSRSKDFIFTAAFQGEQMIDELFAQLPAMASRVFKGINTRSGLQPKAWVGGLKKGFKEGTEDVRLGIETGRAGEGTRYDLPRGQQFAYTPLKDIGVEPKVIRKIAMVGENVLSQLEKTLNYTIRVPDRMFYEAKYASSIADQLKAGGVKEPTTEMIEQAVKEAKDAVYQGDTWASKISLGTRDLLNKIPTGPVKIGDVTMPFVQTVANISEEGLKNVGGLPVGMAKWGMAKTAGELRDAELLIGKGLKSLGYLGVGGGIAAGAIKSNIGDLSTAGEQENSVTGMQPQSIAIGDKSFSLANAPNVTIPIAIYRSLLEQGTPQERAARASMTAMSALGDMPAFQTLGDLSKGIGEIAGDLAQEDLQGAQESAAQMGNQQIANVVGQFVPLTGAMGNIRNIVDPYSREQYTQNLGQYIGNKTINRIPFASKSLPMRYGITGQPVMTTNIKNPVARAVGELVDPLSIRNYTPNPTIDTMSSLTKEAEGIKSNKSFNIKKPKRSIDVNGERIKLSPKQYSSYQKDYGKISYYLRQKAMASDDFKNMDNEEKVKYMQDVNTSVDQAVKSVLFGHNPKKRARYTQDILDNYDTFTK